jgi:hypothetical protein
MRLPIRHMAAADALPGAIKAASGSLQRRSARVRGRLRQLRLHTRPDQARAYQST